MDPPTPTPPTPLWARLPLCILGGAEPPGGGRKKSVQKKVGQKRSSKKVVKKIGPKSRQKNRQKNRSKKSRSQNQSKKTVKKVVKKMKKKIGKKKRSENLPKKNGQKSQQKKSPLGNFLVRHEVVAQKIPDKKKCRSKKMWPSCCWERFHPGLCVSIRRFTTN